MCESTWKGGARECKECGKDFLPDFENEIFCSEDCFCIYNGLDYAYDEDFLEM
jgi:hypothetical protein